MAVVSGTKYTQSIIAKAEERQYLVCRNQNLNRYAVVNLATGLIHYIGSGFDVVVQELFGGWYRISCSFTSTVTGNVEEQWGISRDGTLSAGTYDNYVGTAGFGLYITAVQWNIEHLTDYFPTTSAAIYLSRLPHYDGSGNALGYLVEGQVTNLWQCDLGGQMPTQNETVTAQAYTLQFRGTGSIALSGAYSATVNGSGANTLTTLTFTPSSGTLTATVSGTVTNGQLEVGSVATSFVPNPTTGTMARVADAAVISGTPITTLLGSDRSAGTILLDYYVPASYPSSSRILFIGKDDSSRRIDVSITSGTLSVTVVGSSGTSSSPSAVTGVATGRHKLAVAWNGTNVQISQDGAAIVTISRAFGGSAMIDLVRLLNGAGGTNYLGSVTRALYVSTAARTDLAALSAL